MAMTMKIKLHSVTHFPLEPEPFSVWVCQSVHLLVCKQNIIIDCEVNEAKLLSRAYRDE